VLRRWTPADAPILDALVQANLDHLRGYMPWIAEEPLGGDGRRTLLEGWERAWREGSDVVFGIFADDVAVGGTGLHRRIGPRGLEIGYWVDRSHLGAGIARRASEALTTLAFTVADIEAVEIHHDLTNVVSRRVPESLGYRLVGRRTLDRELAPDESGIELMWRVTRDDWAARSTR